MSSETYWAQRHAREQAHAAKLALFETVLQELPATLQALPHVLLTQRKHLPTSSGVYMALNLNPTVLYVGSTQNLYTRWRSHEQYHTLKQRGATRIAYWCHEDHRICQWLEQHYIERYTPAMQEVEYPTAHHGSKKAQRYDVALSSTEYGHAQWFAAQLTEASSGHVYTPEEALTHAAMQYITQQYTQRRNR